jgi:chromosome segregation ATPase
MVHFNMGQGVMSREQRLTEEIRTLKKELGHSNRSRKHLENTNTSLTDSLSKTLQSNSIIQLDMADYITTHEQVRDQNKSLIEEKARLEGELKLVREDLAKAIDQIKIKDTKINELKKEITGLKLSEQALQHQVTVERVNL